MSRSTKVHIFGQSYTIAGDLEEAYVRELAGYVDEKMQAIASNTSTIVIRSGCSRSLNSSAAANASSGSSV